MDATSRVRRRRRWRDRGAVTVEAAIALCGFVAVLALVLAGLSAVLDEIRCTDAAEQAARLVARGDGARARQAAARIAPHAATVRISTDGDTATVTVSADPVGGLLPGLRLTATAYAVLEPQPPTNPPTATSTATSTATATATPAPPPPGTPANAPPPAPANASPAAPARAPAHANASPAANAPPAPAGAPPPAGAAPAVPANTPGPGAAQSMRGSVPGGRTGGAVR